MSEVGFVPVEEIERLVDWFLKAQMLMIGKADLCDELVKDSFYRGEAEAYESAAILLKSLIEGEERE